MLSSESEDDDSALEPCVTQPTGGRDAVDGISGDDFDLTVGDPPEVQAVTMRRPTARRLVLVPRTQDPDGFP